MARIDELRAEAKAMQKYLETNTSGTIEEYIDRLDTLGVYYARSGAMLAEVKSLNNAEYAKLMCCEEGRTLVSTFAPSIAKAYFKGLTAEYEALEVWLDRINAACNKQCDNLRTLISYEKQRAQIL